VETTSLLKKKVISPKLGGITGILLIYGWSFSSSENGLGWVVPFQSGKWFEIFDEQLFSSLDSDFRNENGSIDC
jgi:hypothetical protein